MHWGSMFIFFKFQYNNFNHLRFCVKLWNHMQQLRRSTIHVFRVLTLMDLHWFGSILHNRLIGLDTNEFNAIHRACTTTKLTGLGGVGWSERPSLGAIQNVAKPRRGGRMMNLCQGYHNKSNSFKDHSILNGWKGNDARVRGTNRNYKFQDLGLYLFSL